MFASRLQREEPKLQNLKFRDSPNGGVPCAIHDPKGLLQTESKSSLGNVAFQILNPVQLCGRAKTCPNPEASLKSLNLNLIPKP